MNVIKNARVFSPLGHFFEADVRFDDNILEIGRFETEGIDANDAYLLPGLIDIHTHGANGADYSDADEQALNTMGYFHARHGVTSYVGTAMALEEEKLMRALGAFRAHERKTGQARLLGVHMEGPFISKGKRGAHEESHIAGVDRALFWRLNEASGGKILFADVAPELPHALEFIKEAASACVVSLAHTNATYEEAVQGFLAGATHVTHLFNAMPPFLHRAPGLVGAARDMGAYVEIIADGVHLHESVVRAVFSMFDPNKVVLISDSMRAAGLSEGEYTLGGKNVTVRGGKAALKDGTIAGSSATLLACVRYCVSIGIPLPLAIRAATQNAAAAMNKDMKIGRIEQGYMADLLLLDESLNLIDVYIGGVKCE